MLLFLVENTSSLAERRKGRGWGLCWRESENKQAVQPPTKERLDGSLGWYMSYALGKQCFHLSGLLFEALEIAELCTCAL